MDSADQDSNRWISWIKLPNMAVLVGVLLSLLAWLFPAVSDAGKGFVAGQTTATEFFWTVAAYVSVVAASLIGYHIGIPVGKRLSNTNTLANASLHQTGIWTIWIAIASAGVMYAAFKVTGAVGLQGCIRIIGSFNANALKEILYTDYNVGLLSLRYVAILAAGIGIFRYLAFREFSIRTVLSFGLLLIVAVMSSRLSLVWATAIGFITYVLAPNELGKRKIAVSEIVAFAAIFTVLIAALTISRTYGFYQEQGAQSVYTAVASEVQRYLAAPFQGSIEAVNHPRQGVCLHDLAGIDSGLTTNSGLFELAMLVGRWNVAALMVILAISGMACGILRRFRSTYLIVALGVLQCCHFEIWRLVMFSRGITITLLFFSIVIPLIVAVVRVPAMRLPAIRVRLH